MRYEQPKCPTCGGRVRGEYETLPCCAEVYEAAPGVFEFVGHTEVFWDGQTPSATPDRVTLLCAEGHEWETRDLDETTAPEGSAAT